MIVHFKKLYPGAIAPTKAHANGDAGFDLTAHSVAFDEYGNYVYGTGVAVEIPEGYVGLVFPRSSVSKTDLFLTNAVGVIDPGYRGEIMVKFKSSLRPVGWWSLFKLGLCKKVFHKIPKSLDISSIGSFYNRGERVAQLIIVKLPVVDFRETVNLSESERGDGGFGSSGK